MEYRKTITRLYELRKYYESDLIEEEELDELIDLEKKIINALKESGE